MDAVAEAAGRTSGAVYAHFDSKQGLLLAVLDSWAQSVVTVLSAEVALSTTPEEQLAAVWSNVGSGDNGVSDSRSLLEHELRLRATRDPQVASALRTRSAEARRRTASELDRWSKSIGAQPVADSEGAAVLVKALLDGLELQRRLEPGSVPSHLAVRGLAALVGMPATTAIEESQPVPPTNPL